MSARPSTGTVGVIAPENQTTGARRLRRRVYYVRRFFAASAFALVVLIAVVTVDAMPAGRKQPAHPVTRRVPTAASATPSQPDPATVAPGALLPPIAPGAPTYLAPGSDPAVLPGPILIADKLNSRLIVVDPQGHIRWAWPRPGDLAPGETFHVPDDAFFSADGRYIIATQEDDFVVTVIDVATRKIAWRYGHPGVSGSRPGYVWNPDDAMMLPGGTLISADIKNCRVIEIPFGASDVSWQEGQAGSCTHSPPQRYGSPNGVFPTPGGRFLVTEINGDWVDEIDTSGHVYWSAHPPGVAYPSDSNQIGPGRYLTVDYSEPGAAVVFDRTGKALWAYRPTSGPPAQLNHPSLGIGLPNGDLLLTDDWNHRVIVIDPTTDRIVWQYGHDTQPGNAPGYLNNPDGLDPLPPYAFADQNHS